jgi:hypothetical protein
LYLEDYLIVKVNFYVKFNCGVGAIVLVATAVAIAALASSVPIIEEGKIGIYFVNGALTNDVRH